MRFQNWVSLLLILIVTAFLRLWQLGIVPPSLDWDEASIGYNAYSILKTGSDEYGNRFPVSIRSFGDYKPPLYVYVTVPSLAIFGRNEFAVRLPSALAGILTVLATFFLVRKLTTNPLLSHLSAGLLAISPWHIQFSRVAFEANLALFFFVVGGYFLVTFLTSKTKWSFILMILTYSLSLYSYHSARLIVPAFLIGIGLYYWKTFWSRKKILLLGFLFGFLLIVPLVGSFFGSDHLQARFSEVSIFSSAGLRDTAKNTLDSEQKLWRNDQTKGDLFGKIIHGKIVTYGRLLGKNYLDHFNFNFLFLDGDGNGRHHAPGVGLLYLWEAPIILLGLYFLLINRPPWFFFIGWWFLVAPLAATLTAETPHAIRSLLFLPTYQVFTAYGLLMLYQRLVNNNHLVKKSVLALLAIIIALNSLYYFHQYFVHLPIEFASSFQFGYKEIVTKVKAAEPNYDQVYVTNKYDQPYIYFLFYGESDPKIKNDGTFRNGFGKYHFLNWGELTDSEKGNLKSNVLNVSAPDDFFSPRIILDKVYLPQGEAVFILSHQ